MSDFFLLTLNKPYLFVLGRADVQSEWRDCLAMITVIQHRNIQSARESLMRALYIFI